MKAAKQNRRLARVLALAAIFVFVPPFAAAQDDEEENFIVPVRPSVSESAQIQKKGVLQIETGADFDFAAPDFRNRQTVPLGVYFAVNKKLRLDFEFETVTSQKNRMKMRETGIGDVSLGFKAIARDRPKEQLAVAFSYSVKLPTADEELGTGKVDHNLRLIFQRTIGKNDFIANFSYLNTGREMSGKRDSGGQVILRYDRELTKKIGIITEYFGNTVDEEQPRGLYVLAALTYKLNKRLRLDAGVRPGFGRDAPRFNFFFGLSVGVADLYPRQ